MVSFSARATQNNHYAIHQGFKYTRRALLCTIDYYSSSSSSSLLNFTKKSCWYYLWWYPMTSIIFVFVYIFLLLLDLVYYTKNILYNTHGRWQIDFKLFAWDDRFAIINHLQGEHTQKMLINYKGVLNRTLQLQASACLQSLWYDRDPVRILRSE